MTVSHYSSIELTSESVDDLVSRITTALVNLQGPEQYKYKARDGRIVDSISWNFWEWQQAIGLYGLVNYYALKSATNPNDPHAVTTLRLVKDWYAARAAEGCTTKNINTMAVFLSLVTLMDLDNTRGGVFTPVERETYLGWIDEWGEWAMNDLDRTEMGGFQHITFRLVNENQLWDDTLMMTVLSLAKIGKLLNRPQYIEEAKFQFLLHAQYLMDTKTGLWYHGWEFTGDGSGSGHNYAEALWARGNCWITLAIPDFLELVKLEPSDPVYRMLVGTLTRQVNGMFGRQDPATGLWRTLVDDDGSYVETSGSAGFVGGILMAVRLGLLDRAKYLPMALAGLKGCIAQVQPNGEVANVSKGTPVGLDLDFYRTIPKLTVPYGQSLVILALGEWLRLQEADAAEK
ncbi:uncharacterized protein EHS24_001978 [Apiotrichum porosum]|uniref:Glycosyl hydrolase family 88 n=1 Tax=Apiotrichum porosum TaxID=105984 RepID=A0A427XJH2_9TREE|nr:uncharacterized protein EHS24_001978 [Apiotrichum porosum]RSH79049.1 hypothetical protein EHS24_001978 [Apiotrichum porosum]